MRRFATTFFIAGAMCVVPAAPAFADTGTAQPTNVVGIDVSTPTDPVSTYGHMQVASFSGDDLEALNEAYSHSHDCTGCHSVTIAFQVVLVHGSPSTFAPQNYAIAFNDNCTSCVTEAFARQLVVQTDAPAHLDARAQGAIDVVNVLLQRLAAQSLTPQERGQKVEDLWSMIEQVACRGVRSAHSTSSPACTNVPVVPLSAPPA